MGFDKKSAVTVSELTHYADSRDGTECYQRYIYVECTYCECREHLLRVSVSYEKNNKTNEVVFSDVDFQFSGEYYITQPWRTYKHGWWNRCFQNVKYLFRRLWLAVKVACGGTVYLSVGPDLNLVSAREMAKKLIEVIDEAEGS